MKVDIESFQANTSAGDVVYGNCIMYCGNACMRLQWNIFANKDVCHFARLRTGHVFTLAKDELVSPIDVKVVWDS